MLRGEDKGSRRGIGVALAAAVGAAAALLVLLGNPGNMGICGACFLRDIAGSLGLAPKSPACFRPEIPGLIFGAMLAAAFAGRLTARSGSHAVSRFLLGLSMGVAALVFLGCPFRMLQRLGALDANAWLALPGFVAGVGLALFLEKRGYNVGKTQPAPWPVGFLGAVSAAALLALFLCGGRLSGPGPGAAGKPPHAPWLAALLIAGPVGAALSATGFCAVSAARQVFKKEKAMLLAALALAAGYAAVSAAAGKLKPGFAQPVAHGDLAWNLLSLALVGLTGALAGGCPVRQVVMAGEGNGDAFLTAAGIAAGGALAHNLDMVSISASADAAGGATAAGKAAVCAGLVFWLAYGWLTARSRQDGAPRSP